MKKICTNKSDIYAIYGCIFFVISLFAWMITMITLTEKNSRGLTLLICTISYIVFPTLLTILLSEMHVKKYGKYIKINDRCLIYDDEINIPYLLIKRIEYKKEKDKPKTLYFYMVNDNIEQFTFDKKVVKQIEQLINIPVEYNLKIKKVKVPFKIKWNNFINKIKTLIKENYIEILFVSIGLIITIISFIIHTNNKTHIIINIILSIICFIFGVLEFYYICFTKEKYDQFTRITMSIVASILFIIIVSLLLLLFICEVLKQEATAYVLLWSVYLLPSFVVVIAIVLLIIAALSYA